MYPVFVASTVHSFYSENLLAMIDFFKLKTDNNYICFNASPDKWLAKNYKTEYNIYKTNTTKWSIFSEEGLTYEKVLNIIRKRIKQAPTSLTFMLDNIQTYLKDEEKLFDKYEKWKAGEITLSHFFQDTDMRYYSINSAIIDVCKELNPDCPINIIVDDGIQWKYIFGYQKDLKKNFYYSHYLQQKEVGNIYQYYDKNSTEPHVFECQYLPWMQYGYFRDFSAQKLQESLKSKNYNVVFGMYLHIKGHDYRKKLIMNLNEIYPKLDKTKNLITCTSAILPASAYANLDKPVSYGEYIEKVKQAYWTMLIPSMNPLIFSLRRFIESIMVGCIPLVDKNANYIDGFNNNQEIIKIVEEHLLFDADSMEEKLLSLQNLDKQYYMKVLQLILSTQWFKEHQNKEYYTKYLENITL